MYVLHTKNDTAGLAVHLVLEELELPHRMVLRDRASVGSDAAYLAMHPMGLVPMLETPDGPMFETAAILLWLADRHGGLAPAPTASDRAAFLKWFFFTSTNLHTTSMQLFYPDRYAADDSVIPAHLSKTVARFRGYLRLLDDMAATMPIWCSPDIPSVLGYYVSMLVRWAQCYEPTNPCRIDLADFPGLHRLGAALESRPAALRVAEAEGLGPTIFTAPAM